MASQKDDNVYDDKYSAIKTRFLGANVVVVRGGISNLKKLPINDKRERPIVNSVIEFLKHYKNET